MNPALQSRSRNGARTVPVRSAFATGRTFGSCKVKPQTTRCDRGPVALQESAKPAKTFRHSNIKCFLRATARFILWLSTLILAAQDSLHADGVVTNCTEADLRAALVDGGTVTFACDGTITLASQLTIDTDTTLDATGRSITLSGGGTTRVLLVQAGVKLTLKRLTISDGYVSMTGFGAGLQNSGEATVSDCTFSNNAVVNGPMFGGAINHEGTKLVVTGTTFMGNRAEANGGALSCGNPFFGNNPAIGNIAITNCTFYANGGNGAAAFGQSIGSPVTFVNCTFASNSFRAIQVFSGGSLSPARVRVVNSIFSDTVGGDNVQGIEDWGNNLSTDNSASLTNATSLKNTDPLLGPLADNGGPTLTMGLLYGSPAMDAAYDSAGPGTDQRGVARPTRTHSDIGAFEGSISPNQSGTVHFASTNFVVGESQGTALVQVERTGSSTGTAGVTVSATAGTAAAGVDFAPTNIALVFAEGEMQKSVAVTIFNDSAPETNETVILNLSSPVGTVPDSPSASQLTILDEDAPYVLTNYTDAGLRAAVDNGGWIQFPSNGTITLTSPITVSQFTVLDASGHDVLVSGGNAVRLLNINPNASLTLMNLTLANGRHQGPNGAAGADGGQGCGGAINIDNGTLNLLGCRIWTNIVVGGVGGNGNPNGSGGPGLGGAIYLFHGTLNATNSEFAGNLAMGGADGTNSSFAGTGTGGLGEGGTISGDNGTVNAQGCSFLRNTARGGDGTTSNAGDGGVGLGGAIYLLGGAFRATNCVFAMNTVFGGTGGGGSVVTTGGGANGGFMYNQGASVQFANSVIASNAAVAGEGRRLGAIAGTSYGGETFGGAVYTTIGDVWLVRCAVSANSGTAGKARSASGGAIYQNGGNIHIVETLLESNQVTGGPGFQGGFMSQIPAGPAYGGGCFIATGAIWLTNSTLSRNLALGGAGNFFGDVGSGFGGGVFNSGTLQAANSTLFGNTSRSGTPGTSTANQGSGLGGGLYNDGGSMALNFVTISRNSAEQITGGTPETGSALGGGIYSTTGTTMLHGTIVANNLSGSNAFGHLVDGGYNLGSDSSCSFTNTGSLNNADPRLGPLDDYGGPTATMPLLAGSPAIDAGDSSSFPPTDQRGRARPYGASPDIGAFESSPPFVIRGTISGATLREEAMVAAGLSTVLTANGIYRLSLSPGNYSVTPQSSNYLFVPTNRSLAVGPDQLGVDFKAYRWNALSLDDYTNGILHLVFAGTNGQTQRLQASTNLAHWDAIATNAIGPSNYFETFIPMTGGIGFYRTTYP